MKINYEYNRACGKIVSRVNVRERELVLLDVVLEGMGDRWLSSRQPLIYIGIEPEPYAEDAIETLKDVQERLHRFFLDTTPE